MPGKARSPDNARAEGFFGTLKGGLFDGRGRSGATFEELSETPGACIGRRRSERPKRSPGWKATRQRRAELGYAA